MQTADIPQPADETNTALGPLLEQVRQYVDQSLSENTRRAYRADWNHFESWCAEHDVDAMPAEPATVASYISAMASGEASADGEPFAASTIQRRLSSLRVLHRAQGHDDPTDAEIVAKTWQGIRNDEDVQVAQNGRAALLAGHIRRMVDALDLDSVKGKRDRALLLLGYALGARRSELSNLDVDDLEFCADGLLVTIRQSKTDQEGKGRTVSVSYGNGPCAVSAVREWLEAAELEEGALFRTVDRWGNIQGNRLSGKSVNRAVKAAAEAAGMDADQIGAHSLRAGHVTQRKKSGASNEAIMYQTGHTSESTMRRYDRRAKHFKYNEASDLGL